MPHVVDNLSENEEKRRKMLEVIHNMASEGFKANDIANVLGISTRTVSRYRNCDPDKTCRLSRPSRRKEMVQYKDQIVHLIQEGYHASGIADELQKKDVVLQRVLYVNMPEF